jgi:hypothetical protein
MASEKTWKRPAIITLAVLVTSLCVASVAIAQVSETPAATPQETPSLSLEGQSDQAAYDALEEWLAEWDAQKESEAATASPADDARPSYSPDPWADGLGDGDFPYPAPGYSFESDWEHSDGDHYWAVYSGANEDSDYGVLLVQRIEPGTMQSTFLRVDTDEEGSLIITGSEGMTLSISPDAGPDFTFDVSNLSSDDVPTNIDHVTHVTEVAI